MRLLYSFLIILIMLSCRSTKIPEGSPEEIRPRELQRKMKASNNEFNTLSIRATGNYSDDNSSHSFRLQIRILRDSLIWIDIADPLLGIKVARAVVYPDSVAFMERLNKKYYTGTIEELQKKFNLDLGFTLLQSLLSANLAIDAEGFNLHYQPGYYLLTDHKLDEKGNPMPVYGDRELNRVWIDPVYFKPSRQLIHNTANGEKRELEYHQIKPQDEVLYPEIIKFKFVREEEVKIELDIRNVEKNGVLNFPFTIPSGYAKMR